MEIVDNNQAAYDFQTAYNVKHQSGKYFLISKTHLGKVRETNPLAGAITQFCDAMTGFDEYAGWETMVFRLSVDEATGEIIDQDGLGIARWQEDITMDEAISRLEAMIEKGEDEEYPPAYMKQSYDFWGIDPDEVI